MGEHPAIFGGLKMKAAKKLPRGRAGAVARWGTARQKTATIRVHASVNDALVHALGSRAVEAASAALAKSLGI